MTKATGDAIAEPTALRDDLRAYGVCTLDDDGCSTCGDVGVPVRVVRLLGEGEALCEDRAGERAEIATDFAPGTAPGDVLLVHMGVAIARPSAAAS